MSTQSNDGDNITVGNVSAAQGIAIGRQATARVVGHNISSDIKLDAGALRSALEQLKHALDDVGVPADKRRDSQTLASEALEAVKDHEVNPDQLVENLKKIGEKLKQANVAVQEGSTLWESVKKLAPLLGPLVGGARVVAAWFGVPL